MEPEENMMDKIPENETCCCGCTGNAESPSDDASCCCDNDDCCCDSAENMEDISTQDHPSFGREPRVFKQASEEDVEKAKKILEDMFAYLGMQGTIKGESRPRSVNFLVASQNAGKIIGHRGVILESLQLVLNRIMQKMDADFPKIYIDIDGPRRPRMDRLDRPGFEHREFNDRREFSGRRNFGGRRNFEHNDSFRRKDGVRYENSGNDRKFTAPEENDGAEHDSHECSGRGFFGRDDKLRQQAIDAAKEVRLFGESKTLPPMNPHDRRIIHMTLKNEDGIVTESIGDGDCRSVVITPKDIVS